MATIKTVKLTDGKQTITVNELDAKDVRFKGFKPAKTKTEAKTKSKDK